MTRRKQRRRRHSDSEERARRIEALIASGQVGADTDIPLNAIPADLSKQAFDWGASRLFYQDYAFRCQACGAEEILTASQQLWWYETAKGSTASFAIHCRRCRKNRRARARYHDERRHTAMASHAEEKARRCASELRKDATRRALLKEPLEELRLPLPVQNVLHPSGLRTIGELMAQRSDALDQLLHRSSSLQHIKKALEFRGLALIGARVEPWLDD